eukprot:CAMPEP_0201869334 /NCGR_PEP_ID=MMETSP0902-20130614/2888_1 /ASSEMBLY_ACC=CAM_ASM_000551 /TAXON_ID=420261 /ORGANISM="Thalassiosira antarctica, Strain CCMP982" /LENGTH=177 /DNA_ID=CAMNT_0048394827 /DNA_START=180 /DNA_END=713 /DNA_ORIENTATION=-
MTPTHELNAHNDREGLEHWLHHNRSSCPRLAKWLALFMDEEDRTQTLVDIVTKVLGLFPVILEILDHRWYEEPFEHPILPMPYRGMAYTIHLHRYPPPEWKQKRISLERINSLVRSLPVTLVGFGPPAAQADDNLRLGPYTDGNLCPLVPAQFFPVDRRNMLTVRVLFPEEEAIQEN